LRHREKARAKKKKTGGRSPLRKNRGEALQSEQSTMTSENETMHNKRRHREHLTKRPRSNNGKRRLNEKKKTLIAHLTKSTYENKTNDEIDDYLRQSSPIEPIERHKRRAAEQQKGNKKKKKRRAIFSSSTAGDDN
jgi:hypothetical protein